MHAIAIAACAAAAGLVIVAAAAQDARAVQGDRAAPEAKPPFAAVPQQQGAVRRDDDRSGATRGDAATRSVSQSAPAAPARVPPPPGRAVQPQDTSPIAAPKALPAQPVAGVPIKCDTAPGAKPGLVRIVAANTTGSTLPAGSDLEWRLERKKLMSPGGKPVGDTVGGTHRLASQLLPGRTGEIGQTNVPMGYGLGDCRATAYRAAPKPERR